MAQLYFTNINVSADALTGTGSDQNPYSYSQFMTSLATIDETTVDNYYYLLGYRSVSAVGSSANPVDAENVWMLSKKNVYIDSWGDDPWKINFENDFYLESYVDWFETIHLQNGFIKTTDSCNLKFSIDTNVSAFCENCWIDGSFDDVSSEYSGGSLYFINSTLNNFKLTNVNFNKVYFTNTIIINPTSNSYYLCDNTIFTDFYFDNVVSNRSILDQTSADAYNVLNPSEEYGLDTTYSLSEVNTQDTWDISNIGAILSAEVSAIALSSLDYLSSDFLNITISGNDDSQYNSSWSDNETRDGVGALYFPTINPVLSASTFSGDIPLSVDFLTTLSGDNTSAISLTYTFGDGNTSATTSANPIVTHSYSATGIYSPSVSVTSYNSWYSVSDSLDSSVSAFTGVLSGNIEAVDISTSAIITSGYINNPIAVSSTYLSGSPSTYDVIWGDGTSASDLSISDNLIYQEHTYSDYGNYVIQTIIKNGVDPDITLSADSITIEEISQRTFYVNINRSYDTTATNIGTSSSPLDYGELVSKLTSGSNGVNYDRFKLQGYRELSASTEIIETNTSAQYTIDAWDLSAYGPWMICKDDNYLYNYSMSFIGSNIIGGLYYNKPRLGIHGTTLKISEAKNMYIVVQGYGSQINLDICETAVSAGSTLVSAVGNINIIGSTIYSENGFRVGRTYTTPSFSALSGECNIIDSVITGMVDVDNPDEVYIIRESGSQPNQIVESGSQTNVYKEGG